MMFRSFILMLLLSMSSAIYSMDRLPIHEAAMRGDADSIARILDEDPTMIDKREELSAYGFTPLLWAAMNGHKNVIRVLLKHGANINIRDVSAGHKPWDYVIVRRVAIELEKERELLHQAQLALLMGGHARLGANSSLQAIHNMLPQIAQYLRPENFQDVAVQAAAQVAIPRQGWFSRMWDLSEGLKDVSFYLGLIIKDVLGY